MKNLHYVIYDTPVLEKKKFNKKLEILAERIFLSGKLRVDAVDKKNFVKLNLSGFNKMLTFSHREIEDRKIFERKTNELEDILSRKFKGEELLQKKKELVKYLIAEKKKNIPLGSEAEMKLCRLIVQSSHPVLSMLLHIEQSEIFVSYEHYIGDMLDMEGWRSHGQNSGMQASNILESTIYVSCGGDPLLPEKLVQYDGDGINAASRFMVIAGQEIGHYADMIRDDKGRYISRHSADYYGKKPSEKVRIARNRDIERLEKLEKYLLKIGVEKISDEEKGLKFLKTYRKMSRRFFFTWFWARFKLYFMLVRLRSRNLSAIAAISCISKELDDFRGRRVSATKIFAFIKDMKFNLSPKADVYKRNDPVEEEAIACIEALARVPQQVNKWGHRVVKFATPNLYKIYYKEVIPACVQAYEKQSGRKYKL